LELLFKFFVFI